jgi:hypothetical protein
MFGRLEWPPGHPDDLCHVGMGFRTDPERNGKRTHPPDMNFHRHREPPVESCTDPLV